MATKPESWQKRFSLKTCTAQAIDSAIPPTALGVAVIYTKAAEGDNVFLVIESRAGSLRAQCEKRLKTAKLPPLETLTVSFACEVLSDASRETVDAACRQQVILAGELRRELRPAMR